MPSVEEAIKKAIELATPLSRDERIKVVDQIVHGLGLNIRDWVTYVELFKPTQATRKAAEQSSDEAPKPVAPLVWKEYTDDEGRPCFDADTGNGKYDVRRCEFGGPPRYKVYHLVGRKARQIEIDFDIDLGIVDEVEDLLLSADNAKALAEDDHAQGDADRRTLEFEE